MYEITKDNYKDVDFDGVIISVPRQHLKDELTQDFSLHFECAYYTEGKHGYKTTGHNPDKSSFFSVWYGDEDMPNGFGFNSTSRLPWDEKYLYFDNVRYYKFEDMEEFCQWYLQQKGCEIWTTSGDLKGEIHKIEPRKETTVNIKEDKEWIREKCGTNTPPRCVPKHPSKGNKKKLFSETEEQKIGNTKFGKNENAIIISVYNINGLVEVRQVKITKTK